MNPQGIYSSFTECTDEIYQNTNVGPVLLCCHRKLILALIPKAKTDVLRPRAKKTCIGNHEEVCTAYHKTLHFLGASHRCAA